MEDDAKKPRVSVPLAPEEHEDLLLLRDRGVKMAAVIREGLPERIQAWKKRLGLPEGHERQER